MTYFATWFGLVWFGLVWFDLVWFGLVHMEAESDEVTEEVSVSEKVVI